MKINEKTLFAFANSKPVDKEGYLSKRGEGKLTLIRNSLVVSSSSSQHLPEAEEPIMTIIISA